MRRFRIACQQWVPDGQVLAVGQPPIGTAIGQPFEALRLVNRQHQAIRDPLGPIRIVRAAAGIDIQQSASDVGVENFAAILIFELVHATQGATIAQPLPLRGGHFSQRFAFPILILHRHALCGSDRKISMKAVFLDYATMGPDLDLATLRAQFSDLELFDDTNDDQIAERISDAEFVFTNKIRLTPELIQSAGKLRYIGLTATGTDNIDLDAAKQHGIAVANIRAYCTQSVVEHVMGALLMLSHNLHRYDTSVKAGDWQKATDFCMLSYPIRELSGMTLGLVGYGSLGQGVAAAAKTFGMHILVSARPGASEVPADRVPFDEVLQRSDVISLHCPLTDETRNLFDATTIGRMKPGAMLINTARGALIDSNALADALNAGQLSGAAIDVLAQEPPVDGNALLDYRGANLIVTPHIAWGTDKARQNAIDQLADCAATFLAGTEKNRVV
jgi:glycerate dehydrogenase